MCSASARSHCLPNSRAHDITNLDLDPTLASSAYPIINTTTSHRVPTSLEFATAHACTLPAVMATSHSDESLLLALPMELIDRIAIHLDDDHDAMFNARLTCKTLEAATFDRFAQQFFTAHGYCITNKRSLLRLQDLLASSSRLMARMRYITFTSSFFTNMTHKQVKLALNQSEDHLGRAQVDAMDAYAQCQVKILHKQSLPDAQLLRRVLVASRLSVLVSSLKWTSRATFDPPYRCM